MLLETLFVAQTVLVPGLTLSRAKEIYILLTLITIKIARDLLEGFGEYPWMFYLGMI